MESQGMWGQYEMTVGADTVVEGYAGKNILCNRVSTFNSGPGGETFTSQTGFELFGTVFEQGDSLLYLDQVYAGEEGTVRLLYDFGAVAGDSWLLKVDTSVPCLDSTFVQVLASGVIDINGEDRRYIDVSTSEGSVYILEGRAIEGLGLINSQGFGFFPGHRSDTNCWVYDGDETTFSCYSDSELGSYPEAGSPCSFLSVAEVLSFPISIYPVPASQSLFIDSPVLQNSDLVQILDLKGRKLKIDKFSKYLNISDLDSGIYILQIINNEKVVYSERLVVE